MQGGYPRLYHRLYLQMCAEADADPSLLKDGKAIRGFEQKCVGGKKLKRHMHYWKKQYEEIKITFGGAPGDVLDPTAYKAAKETQYKKLVARRLWEPLHEWRVSYSNIRGEATSSLDFVEESGGGQWASSSMGFAEVAAASAARSQGLPPPQRQQPGGPHAQPPLQPQPGVPRAQPPPQPGGPRAQAPPQPGGPRAQAR